MAQLEDYLTKEEGPKNLSRGAERKLRDNSQQDEVDLQTGNGQTLRIYVEEVDDFQQSFGMHIRGLQIRRVPDLKEAVEVLEQSENLDVEYGGAEKTWEGIAPEKVETPHARMNGIYSAGEGEIPVNIQADGRFGTVDIAFEDGVKNLSPYQLRSLVGDAEEAANAYLSE